MEITPKLLDFTGIDHLVKNLICISSLLFHTQIIAAQDLVVFHVSHTLEMVNDPFVEVEPPVCQGVSELSSSLALSIVKRGQIDAVPLADRTYFPR